MIHFFLNLVSQVILVLLLKPINLSNDADDGPNTF